MVRRRVLKRAPNKDYRVLLKELLEKTPEETPERTRFFAGLVNKPKNEHRERRFEGGTNLRENTSYKIRRFKRELETRKR